MYNNWEPINKPIEIGDKVMIMDSTDKNYQNVGVVKKQHGIYFVVQFNVFKAEVYPAMKLQVVRKR